MSVEDYYAAARMLGLRPSRVPGVWLDRQGEPHNLPDPEVLSPSNRRLTIAFLRSLMGQ